MSDLSQALGNLSAEQLALVHARLQQLRRKDGEGSSRRIPRRETGSGDAPLSFQQEQLWFLDQLDPGSSAYNQPSAIRLSGDLDARALTLALEEIVGRHEALRTTFHGEEGRPVQRVEAAGAFFVPRVDLSNVPAGERAALLTRLVRERTGRPMDLGHGPLIRATLFRLGPAEHVLEITLHHIVSDGWSAGVLVHELAALYTAFRNGKTSPLPPLAVQYPDYAAWQRQTLTGEALETQIGWWRTQLAGAPTILELPVDRPRPAVQTDRGAVRPMSYPQPLAESLKGLAERSGSTLFMVFLAVFQTLIQRYTGRLDVVLGTDVANRIRPEIEPLIGFFGSQVVLRTDLSGDPTLLELLERVRRMVLDTFAHQEVPFPAVVEALQPERDLGRTPLFQVMLSLQKAPGEVGLPGLTLSGLTVETGTSKFELVVVPVESPTSLGGWAEYNSDLFDATTIERLLHHFEILLGQAATDPTRKISTMELIAPAERHQLLLEWNDSAVEFNDGQTLPALLAEQAARTPDAVVATCLGESLTWSGLMGRAAAVASEVEPGTVVALLAERGLDFLAAVVGVFAAGAAYLPLDPEHPSHRVARVIGNAGTRLALAGEGLRDQLDAALALVPEEVRPAARDLAELIRGGGGDLPSLASPDDLAYVLYTSGSTGMPKGAMITHRGMLNHLRAKIHDLGLDAGDTVAQTASPCFDISVWQLLAGPLAGGRVDLVPDDIAADPARLLDHSEAAGVTVIETVPSLMRLLLDEVERHAPGSAGRPRLSGLRWMIPTGEALPPDLCRRWLAAYPRIPLLNAYGPTECSDDVTHHPIRPDGPLSADAASVPIGRSVPNLRLYALEPGLDPGASPVPAGVTGELWVGGAGVGRGYLGDPARTAEVFLPDPFAGEPGSRLYRTGDLGRRRADGTLEFLGRVDQQVKVRGVRIELGEIEAALRGHPAVLDAAVVVLESGGQSGGHTSGHARLAAYVVENLEAQTEEAGPGELEGDKLDQWRTVFDEVYRRRDAVSDSDEGVNLRVWVDSYTGRAMPQEDIVECFEDSVERLLALKPRRVLELGCGTGLLLFRIAPHCEAYWGTDLSPEVVRDLEERVALQADLPEVRVSARGADELDGIPERAFDVVVVNEVVQYFPSADYLVRVIERAAERVAPGGYLFVGGVRNHDLLDAFHASVQLFQAPDALTVDELAQRVRGHVVREKELLVSPDLFPALRERLPRLRSVGIQLKGGRCLNELTRFRYDVVLRFDEPAPGGAETWIDWRRDGLTLDGLRRKLSEAPDAIGIIGVGGLPNARLQLERRLLERLRGAGTGSGEAVTALRRDLAAAVKTEPGIEPSDVWALAGELGYEVDLTWSASGLDRFDAVFRRPGAAQTASPPQRPARVLPWSRYANNPLRGLFAERMVPRLRAFLVDRLPEAMVPAYFVPLDALPLTANGKLDRRALPAPEEERPDLGQAFVAPRTRVEETLAALWAQALRLDHVGVHDNFFELGGDSILSLQIIARAAQDGIQITPRQMFQYQTIAELATAAVAAVAAGGSSLVRAEQGPVIGEAPLTPIQRWFFDLDLPNPHHWNWNVASFFEVGRPLDPARLHGTVRGLLRHHDALRTRFLPDAGAPHGWRQVFAGVDDLDEAVPYIHLDLSGVPEPLRKEAIEAAAVAVQTSLNLTEGPALRMASFWLDPEKGGTGESGRLLLAVHHAVLDGISWRLLLEDFETLYSGGPLPAKTTSFKEWSARRVEYASSPEAAAEVGWWLDERNRETAPLPVDFAGPRDPGREGSSRSVVRELTAEETRALLQEIHGTYQTRIDDVLRTALVEAFAGWTGRRRLLVDFESHGREHPFDDVDLSRTIGWFTSMYPVMLDLDSEIGPGEALCAMKEQLRRLPPGGGLGYGALRYLLDEGGLDEGGEGIVNKLRAMPKAEILFNYLGQMGAADSDSSGAEGLALSQAPESGGPALDPLGMRSHLLEINAVVLDGTLRMEWTYSADRHRGGTVERLADAYNESLRALIAHCRNPEAGAYTPSDFPEADLNADDFSALMTKLGKR